MLCDLCGQVESHFLIGNQQTGDQLALCPADAARWGLDLAKAVLDPEEITSIMLGTGAVAADWQGAGPEPEPKTGTEATAPEEPDEDEDETEGEPATPAPAPVE